jgi:uncharacterized repeat protein (TIGR01451 family)
MKTTIAAVICLILFILCACAAPADAPFPPQTAAPTRAPLPGPALTATPPDTEPETYAAVASAPLTGADREPSDATGAADPLALPLCGRLGRTVGCDLGAMRGGDAATVTLDLSLGGTETLVTSTQLAGVDWDISADRAPTTTAVGAAMPLTVPTATDLVLQASAPQHVVAGQPFPYTYTITNRGAADATGVTFQYPLPPATTLSAYAPGLPHCEGQDDTFTCYLSHPDSGEPLTFTLVITGHLGQPMVMYLDQLTPGWPACVMLKESEQLHVLNCDLGVLKHGQVSRVRLRLIAGGVVARTMTHTAFVSANEAEENDLDNTNTSTVTVKVRADLALGAALGPVGAGKTLSYTLTVTNTGPSDANEALLSAALPRGTELLSVVAAQGRACQQEPGGDLVCDLGRLDSGNAIPVTITITLDQSLPPGVTRTLTHSARVEAKQPDPDPTNNEVTGAIPVGDGEN